MTTWAEQQKALANAKASALAKTQPKAPSKAQAKTQAKTQTSAKTPAKENAAAVHGAGTSPGARAEQTAAAFLRGRGLRILACNYRAPGGELDLIAEDAGTLAFIEVRLRSGARHGGALESIDRRKRRRIVLAARHYLAHRPGAEPPCRFDAVLLLPVTQLGRESYAIEWLRDAFRADDS